MKLSEEERALEEVSRNRCERTYVARERETEHSK